MSARREVTVETIDHGTITLPEPDWCAGHDDGPEYRVDVTHRSADQLLDLPVHHDRVAELLNLGFESRPFTEQWPGTGPFVSVGFDGEHYPTDVAGLEAMASELERHAAVLRDYAVRLAALLAGGDR